jgi:hypothetical protein
MAPRVCWPILLALGVLGWVGTGCAQESGDDAVSYSKHPVFRIPFNTDSAGRLKQIQLYVSADKGQSWKQVVAVAPEQRFFDFRAPADGLYWFTVRTVDLENKTYPQNLEGARPGLKVIVDTQPPVVRLRALPSRDGEVGVEWDVRDDNLLPTGIRLEQRLQGGTAWMPLAADLPASGQKFWRPGTNGIVEVRLIAVDQATNAGEDKTTVTPGPFSGRALPTAVDPAPAPVRVPESAIRLVNTKRIGLNYEIKDKGPSGVSAVELWYTQDPACRSWQKYREEDGKTPPPFLIDVEGEGLYGFTLVVRSGVGLGERPPQVGDKPQVWVEVDLTKPLVKLGPVDVGRGADSGRLTIHWTATDKNLGPKPITITYAKDAAGPWMPVAANLENNGRFVWQMPSDVPYQFLIRVEAADRAGNVGADETQKPVIVDLLQPKGVILNVEPVTR